MSQKSTSQYTYTPPVRVQYLRSAIITAKNNPIARTKPLLRKLCDMLTYCRPHNSASEAEFIDRFLMPYEPTMVDDFGNMHFDRRLDETHRSLFIGHCDSVHRTPGRQTVYFDAEQQIIHTTGECLGSDDASGLAMLMHMMDNNVPGYYIASRAEEIGGQGAKFLADNFEDLLVQFDRAIAFDRKDTYSVITHQGWGRCCSDEFADALSEALSGDKTMYIPDDLGVYTDTAEFGIIPECTNVSIGYFNEHTSYERQDFAHFEALADVVISLKWDDLPVVREPGDSGAPTWDKWGAGAVSSVVSGDSGWLPDEDWFEQEVEEALAAALEGDPDELVYLAAQEYASNTGSSILTIYHSMIERHIDMSMVNEVDTDLSMFTMSEALMRLADKLMSTH